MYGADCDGCGVAVYIACAYVGEGGVPSQRERREDCVRRWWLRGMSRGAWSTAIGRWENRKQAFQVGLKKPREVVLRFDGEMDTLVE